MAQVNPSVYIPSSGVRINPAPSRYVPGSELILVDIRTGEQRVVGGIPAGQYRDVPSISQPNPEAVAEFVASQPPGSVDEAALGRELAKQQQTLVQRFMETQPVSSATYELARRALAKPNVARTPEERQAIQNAASSTGGYGEEVRKQQNLERALLGSKQESLSDRLAKSVENKKVDFRSADTKSFQPEISQRVAEANKRPYDALGQIREAFVEQKKGLQLIGEESKKEAIETTGIKPKRVLSIENIALTPLLPGFLVKRILTKTGESALYVVQNPVGVLTETVNVAANKPIKFGTQLGIMALTFKGIGSIGGIVKAKITSVGIPKIKLSTIKESKAFPSTVGGIKVLEKEIFNGKIQKTFKEKFGEVFGKKEPIVVRTATKSTKLGKVKELAQYEEAAAFYSPKLSMIGLPQFAGLQSRVITKLSLFKIGTEKGLVEVLKPIKFKPLPTTATAKTITLSQYRKLSEFVGIKLENLGTVIKGVSRIKVKPGENIFLREFSKIKTGRRPFKLREIDVLAGGRKATMKAFVEPKAKPGVIYPSRAFQLGATSESEVVLFPIKNTELVRVGAKGIRQKYLGVGSAYVTEGTEQAAVKFYTPKSLVEIKKLPLTEKIAIKLEKVRLARQEETIRRFSRGEILKYEPLITPTRLSVLRKPIKLEDLRVSPVSRVPERKLDRVSFNERNIITRKNIETRPIIRTTSVVQRIFVEETRQPITTTRITTIPTRPLIRRTPIRPTPRIPPRTTTRITTIRTPPEIPRLVTPPGEIPPTTLRRLKKVGRISFGRKKLLSRGFSVFGRVKGKKVQLGFNVPKNLAIKIGAGFAAGTTARSFKIKETGVTDLPDVAPINLNQFRSPKPFGRVAREGFKFVEKSKFAINTIGEIEGLKAGKIRKNSVFS